MKRTRIARESIILIMVGAADLMTTLWWISRHGAEEANPIFNQYLAMGPAVFAMMKIVMLLAPIFLLEWARRRRPRFTLFASRCAIAAYLALYLVGFVRLNPQILDHKPVSPTYETEMAALGPINQPIDPDTVRHLRFMLRVQRLGLVQ